MKNILRILKKELDKIFLSKRMIFSTFILPAVIIFAMYTAMGVATDFISKSTDDHTSIVYIYGDAEELKPYTSSVKMSIVPSEQLSEDEIQTLIANKTIDLYVVSYGVSDNTLKVDLHADTSEPNAQTAYSRFVSILEIYQATELANEGIQLQRYNAQLVEYAEGDVVTTSILAMIIPMMLIIMLFANSMAVTAESIAGEKERGTLATMIMTPIKRSDIIFAKVFSCSIIAVLTALCSFVGMAFSMNRLTASFGITGVVEYGFVDYLYLCGLTVCIALVAVSLFSLSSLIAKSVKEANSLAMPVYLIGMVAAMVSSYSTAPDHWLFYLIPIYNCSSALKAILTFSVDPLNMLITFASSIVYFVGICLLLSKLFKRESVLFTN